MSRNGTPRRALAVVVLLAMTLQSCAVIRPAAIGFGVAQGALVLVSTTRIANYLYNGQPYQHAGFTDLASAAGPGHVPVLLASVESNDAGYFADRAQVQAVLDTLGVLVKRYNLSVVVYAHGWRHNSSSGDPDFAQFENTLRALNLIVRQSDATASSVVPGGPDLPRMIVGVYLGWKGKTTFEWPDSWGVVKDVLSLHVYTTFWSRKQAAERAGRGDLRRFVLALGALHASWADSMRYNSNNLDFVGHSFGGDLLLTALADPLEESLLKAETTGQIPPAPSLQDMPNEGHATGVQLDERLPNELGNVILINPAVEEAQMRYLYEANRITRFAPGQPPVITIFSAENDWARRTLFRFGTTLSNAGVHYEPHQRMFATTALGAGQEMITDTLRLVQSDRAAVAWAKRPVGAPDSVARGVGYARGATWVPEDVVEKHGWIRLLPRSASPRPEAVVIATVDKRVIDNHSGFWREGFIEWLVSYVVALDRAQTERAETQPRGH
jgi:hypothetical protein